MRVKVEWLCLCLSLSLSRDLCVGSQAHEMQATHFVYYYCLTNAQNVNIVLCRRCRRRRRRTYGIEKYEFEQQHIESFEMMAAATIAAAIVTHQFAFWVQRKLISHFDRRLEPRWKCVSRGTWSSAAADAFISNWINLSFQVCAFIWRIGVKCRVCRVCVTWIESNHKLIIIMKWE